MPRERRQVSRPARAGLLSAFLGLAAVTIVVSPLFASAGPGHGWVLTSVGVTAVIVGARAIAANRAVRSALAHSAAVVGIGTGVLATATMGWMVWSAQSAQAALAPPAAVQAPLAAAVPSATVPALSPPPNAVEAAATTPDELVPILGGLLLQMRQVHVDGSPWPTVMNADSAHRVVGFDGRALRVIAVLPADVDMTYVASADASAFRIRLTLQSDPTKYVDYDSNIGTITRSPGL